LQGGGLSLRHREWMIKAIVACPTRHSGMPSSAASVLPCNPKKSGPHHLLEDQYFVTVLWGIKAPMPQAFEAALFASEAMFPDAVAKVLHWSFKHQKEVVGKRLGFSGVERYNEFLTNKKTMHFLPIGIHKFPGYHAQRFFTDPGLYEQCPYLKHIIPHGKKHNEHEGLAEKVGEVASLGGTEKKEQEHDLHKDKKKSDGKYDDGQAETVGVVESGEEIKQKEQEPDLHKDEEKSDHKHVGGQAEKVGVVASLGDVKREDQKPDFHKDKKDDDTDDDKKKNGDSADNNNNDDNDDNDNNDDNDDQGA